MSYCLDCLEDFREDDTGGYNPPCPCGCQRCRSCHDADARENDEWESSDEPDWQDAWDTPPVDPSEDTKHG